MSAMVTARINPLSRAAAANDACVLCGYWKCRCQKARLARSAGGGGAVLRLLQGDGNWPVTAGLYEDMEDQDNELGPEPEQDETECSQRLVLRVVIPTVPNPTAMPLQQCAGCGGWFGVMSWYCSACRMRTSVTGRARTGAGVGG
ncbi:hypothetical protein ACIQNG_35415 [Streptomyces sp. NPDC091377]|uniref:hypothetical protein n=1 Tax=Streptomyces sp. NPDC091377 TaxID=3365995 RepID=UPI00382B7CCE